MKKLANKKPELKWIPIKDLFIDSNYQRDCGSRASKNNIDYMTENFSWGLCGAIIVFAAGAKFAVVDGQHRMAAALAAGEKEMPCVVVDDQDVERQAKSFVLINTKRVQVHTLSAFRAAIAGGDDIAIRVKNICDQANIDIPVQAVKDGMTAPRQTQAVGSLMKMVDIYAEEQILWALNIIPEAYGSAPGKLRAMFIKAMVEFSTRCGTDDKDRQAVIDVIKDINPKELEEDAKTSVRVQGGKTLNVMVDNIERQYKNDGRKINPAPVSTPVLSDNKNLEKPRGG